MGRNDQHTRCADACYVSAAFTVFLARFDDIASGRKYLGGGAEREIVLKSDLLIRVSGYFGIIIPRTSDCMASKE